MPRLALRAAAKLAGFAGAALGRQRRQRIVRTAGMRSASLPDRLRTLGTITAPKWRIAQRLAIVLLGYALFCVIQIGIGHQIVSEQFYMTFVMIVAVLLLVLLARWPFVACAVWIAASPYAKYFLDVKLAKGIPMLNLDNVVLYSLALVLMLRAMKNRHKLRSLETGEILLLAYMLYVFVSKAARLEMGGNTAGKFFLDGVGLWAVVYFVFRAAIKTRDQIVKLAIALVCSSAWTAMTFIYEGLTGQSFYSVMLGTTIHLRWKDVGLERATGVFFTPVEPGHMLIMSIFLALHLMTNTRNAYSRVLYFVATATILVGLYYTYTRNNYICLVLVAMLMPLLARGKRSFRALSLAVMMIVLLVLGGMALSNEALYKRLTAQTLEGRFIANETAMNVIRHNTLFGVGYRNGLDATKKYITNYKQWAYVGVGGLLLPLGVHNTYLQITQEEGIVGALLYYGAILAFIGLGLKVWSRLPPDGVLGKDFVAVLLASSTAWLVSSLTYNSENSFYANGVFLIGFVFIVRLKSLHDIAPNAALGGTTDSSGQIEGLYRVRGLGRKVG